MEQDLRLHQRALDNLKIGEVHAAKEIYMSILAKPYMLVELPPVPFSNESICQFHT